MKTKKCPKCGIEKELNEFSSKGRINKDGRKGLRSKCKSCENEYNKAYRLNNKYKIKEYGLKNKDKRKEYEKEYSKKYYKKNKDKIKEYGLKNKDKIKKRKKEYDDKLRSQELELLNKEFKSFIINNPKYYNRKAVVWTYIIKSDGFYKIGITNNFMRRMKNLNKHISIFEVHRLPIDIERRLHLELDDYRFCYDKQFKGYTELFDINDDIINEIIKREHFKKVKKEFDN